MKKATLTALFMFSLCGFISCANNDNNTEKSADKTDANTAVIENIMTRTSIRHFTNQPITKDTLDFIVKAGMAAPSAMNAQPWEFIIVTEKEQLDSLCEVHPWSNLKTATAAIIVCGNMQKISDKNIAGYWIQDCSAATENILLAAHSFGLGAVWCGVYPNDSVLPGVKRILELPDYITPLNIISMGYPAENPEPKDKFKTENIHYQKW